MFRPIGTVLVALALAGGARSLAAQAADTTAKGSGPDSTLLTAASIDAGRRLFHGQGTCFACHGDKLQGGPIAPPLTGPHFRHISGTYESIVNRIDHGLAGTLMPSHPGRITESQVVIVAAYVYAVSHGLTKP